MNFKEGSQMRSMTLCYVHRLIPLMVAYVIGYLDCSMAWLLLVTLIIVLFKHHSKQSDITSKPKQSETNKEISGETEVWINKVIAQIWPNVVHHMSHTMREEVEASIRATFNKYRLGGNFHFKKMHIGPSPLNLSCIEVEQESPPEEITICADIVYESNCDVKFVWRGIKGGIQDFQIRGRAHLVLRPLLDTSPFIAGYHIIFPEKPDVQYKLSGVGLFLDIPGLREIVNHIISKKLCNLMAESTVTESDNGLAYQRLIESIKEQEGSLEVQIDSTQIEDESSISDKTAICDQTSVFKSDSQEESTKQEERDSNTTNHSRILTQLREEEHLSKQYLESQSALRQSIHNTNRNQPSTPEITQREYPSLSSTASDTSSTRSEYNPIPKPSRLHSLQPQNSHIHKNTD